MATWEDYEVLRRRVPNAAAWGQAGSQEGASVTPDVPPAEDKAESENTPSEDEGDN